MPPGNRGRGRARPASNSSTKAPRMPKTKKKHPREENAGDGGSSGRSRRKHRSFWSLVSVLTGFTALWGWTVWTKTVQSKQKQADDRKTLAAMRRRPLRYTEHAACRLDCRFVSRGQVAQALLEGSINDRKSDPQLRPCPKYVVDAVVDGEQSGRRKNVQAVFAACGDETRVLTVIDRDTDWPCPPC